MGSGHIDNYAYTRIYWTDYGIVIGHWYYFGNGSHYHGTGSPIYFR